MRQRRRRRGILRGARSTKSRTSLFIPFFPKSVKASALALTDGIMKVTLLLLHIFVQRRGSAREKQGREGGWVSKKDKVFFWLSLLLCFFSLFFAFVSLSTVPSPSPSRMY